MMMTKEKIDEKIKFWQKKKRELATKEGQELRKKRIRAFCFMGGEIEKLLGCRLDYDKCVEQFAKFIAGQEQRGGYISKAFNIKKDDDV